MTERIEAKVSQMEQEYRRLREAVWLWDANAGQILWANNAGLTFWQEYDLSKLKRRRFDHAMPGISKLFTLANHEFPSGGFIENFLFWTENGPKSIDCECIPVSLDDGYSGILLIAQKSEEADLVDEFSSDLADQSLSQAVEVDTTFENTLSSPEDQETLKEIAKLLADPDEDDEVEEEPLGSLAAISEALSEEEPASGYTNGAIPLEEMGHTGNDAAYSGPNPFEEGSYARADKEAGSSSQSDSLPFLAKVSHEVRTPLNSIIGFAELMKEERFGELGHSKYKGYVEDILESAYHALSLVNDLLDISKVEAGEFNLTPVDVDLNTVVEHCISSLQPQTGQARLVIRQSLSPGIPKISADKRSLRQIILNLFSNAIRFTAAGGQIIVSTQLLENKSVRLRVRDTGIGMTEDDLARAMEPFGQSGEVMTGVGGTGLGLPLTKALAEANGATFNISSTEGKGTLAEIVFPQV